MYSASVSDNSLVRSEKDEENDGKKNCDNVNNEDIKLEEDTDHVSMLCEQVWVTEEDNSDFDTNSSDLYPSFPPIPKPRKKTPPGTFPCSQCDKVFKYLCNLKVHQRTHSGERPFQCPVCMKNFSTRCNLIGHIKVHTGERPYMCGVCAKCFSSRSNLNDHIKTHTGEKPFSCSQCTRSFTTRSNLVTHIRTHTGQRPYHCSLCDRSYINSSSLKTHMQSHVKKDSMHDQLAQFQTYMMNGYFNQSNSLEQNNQAEGSGLNQTANVNCDTNGINFEHLIPECTISTRPAVESSSVSETRTDIEEEDSLAATDGSVGGMCLMEECTSKSTDVPENLSQTEKVNDTQNSRRYKQDEANALNKGLGMPPISMVNRLPLQAEEIVSNVYNDCGLKTGESQDYNNLNMSCSVPETSNENRNDYFVRNDIRNPRRYKQSEANMLNKELCVPQISMANRMPLQGEGISDLTLPGKSCNRNLYNCEVKSAESHDSNNFN